MQTNFIKEQLKDAGTQRANQILRACVHCGFCTATCPTYKVLGDELDVQKQFLLDLMRVTRTVLNDALYPSEWLVMCMFAYGVMVKLMRWTASQIPSFAARAAAEALEEANLDAECHICLEVCAQGGGENPKSAPEDVESSDGASARLLLRAAHPRASPSPRPPLAACCRRRHC